MSGVGVYGTLEIVAARFDNPRESSWVSIVGEREFGYRDL